MKSIQILALVVLAFAGISAYKMKEKNFYYFCISHSREINSTTGKGYVYITDTKEIICEEDYFITKAADWGKAVQSNCKNSTGCTSDLNYYPTPEAAKIQLENAKKMYSDTTKYMIKKIDI